MFIREKTYRGLLKSLEPYQIFVFGSNTQGIHGAGAALWARKNAGAIYGQARGLQGQSYAIITKDLSAMVQPSISRDIIISQLADLSSFASDNPELDFMIAYSGEGINLNAYTPEEMAEMFRTIEWTENVIFEEKFYKLMKL